MCKRNKSDKVNVNLAGFCVVILVFYAIFASRCMIGCIISETEIQQ